MLEAYRRKIAAGDFSAEQRAQYVQELVAGLSGYTYLEE